MDLFIETLTGTAFELRVSPFETIMSVKAKIQRLEGEWKRKYSHIILSWWIIVWEQQRTIENKTSYFYHKEIKKSVGLKFILFLSTYKTRVPDERVFEGLRSHQT